MKLLTNVNEPQDIKNMNNKQLEQLSEEIRDHIKASLLKTGGHFSSNLGVVELTLALHKEFNSPVDKIIFDIGHQCYTHKIITGRRDEFNSLRQDGGISGFMRMSESDHDAWESAHCGNSIAGAIGYAKANPNAWVVVVIGDGSLSNGQLFEGLNHLGHLNDLNNVIVILNDNNMSISPSVGGTTKMLAKLRTSRKVNTVRNKLKFKTFNKFDKITGSTFKKFSQKEEGIFFEAIGLHYYGIYDGHDFNSIKAILSAVKKRKQGPKIIHFATQKGKGDEDAMNDATGKYHGVNKANAVKQDNNLISWSEVIAKHVLQEMEINHDIFTITPAMIVGSKLENIQNKYPDRMIDVGIAEAHAVTLASSLSLAGKKSFISIYSTFLQRAYDSILHDCAISNTNVVFGIDRAGFSTGDGERNHGIYDISFLMGIPNTIITMPKDSIEAQNLLHTGFSLEKNPFFVRYPREDVEYTFNEKPRKLKIGSWEKIGTSDKISVITYGNNVSKMEEIKASSTLDFEIINARFIKPFDKNMLDNILSSGNKIIVLESVIETVNLATSITNYINNSNFTNKIIELNIENKFYGHGSLDELEKQAKIDKKSIIKTIQGIN